MSMLFESECQQRSATIFTNKNIARPSCRQMNISRGRLPRFDVGIAGGASFLQPLSQE